jgi:hypothetical protein
MIYSPEMTEKIMTAIRAVLLGNNGYADIGNNTAVAEAVKLAGFAVIHTKDAHGCAVYRAFTAQAQKALKAEPLFSVSTYKPVQAKQDGPDYEALILARQDKFFD